MNWYDEIITCDALGLDYDKILDKYSAKHLKSAIYLFKPLVSNYENIVIFKENNIQLYDVKTTILEDDNIKLFGRIFGTVKPFVRILSQEEIEENFIIINNSAKEIRLMLANRNAKK